MLPSRPSSLIIRRPTLPPVRAHVQSCRRWSGWRTTSPPPSSPTTSCSSSRYGPPQSSHMMSRPLLLRLSPSLHIHNKMTHNRPPNQMLASTVNGTTYCGIRARTTGAPQNHWCVRACVRLDGCIVKKCLVCTTQASLWRMSDGQQTHVHTYTHAHTTYIGSAPAATRAGPGSGRPRRSRWCGRATVRSSMMKAPSRAGGRRRGPRRLIDWFGGD